MLKLLSSSVALTIAVAAPANAVPIVGAQGLTPNARALANYIQANYPGVQAIGGVRADPLPDHPSGRAIDVMCGNNIGLCDTIAADIGSQSQRFAVAYILWRVPAHHDHIHITVH